MSISRFTALLCAALVPAMAACGPGDDGEPDAEAPLPGDPDFVRDPALNVENISAHEEQRSHNMGLNCMGCHQPHGPGRGLFTAAGTMFDAEGAPLPGGTVELRTAGAGQGDVVLALEVDRNGNFFTTEALPFPDTSLFPFVKAKSGASSFMPFPTISGACNICHQGTHRVHVE
jgi:hypothetical protein